jgi:hypothetical protein
LTPDLDVAVRVAQALDRAGIEYVVGGSVASSIVGEPRATQDVDFAVRLTDASVSRLIEELGPDFEVDEEMLREAVRRHRSANLYFSPVFLKIDLFVRGATEFDRSEFSRKVPITLEPGATVFVASREDNLLRKLVWFRAGGEVSDQQWRDVLGMLRIAAGTADVDYLRRWAPELGVADLLERVLEQARI